MCENDGPQRLVHWATGIAPGPASESAQAVAFTVACDAPYLFAASPTVSPDGTLAFTPARNVHGTAQVSVVLVDSEGARSAEQVFTIAIAPEPPRVQRILLNDGEAQRSMLRSIAVQFSEDVSGSLRCADLVLLRDGLPIPASALAMRYDPLTHTATWTMGGYRSRSLPDGDYEATLVSAGIRDEAGSALAGGNCVFAFRRLFGDGDGDGDVDADDLAQFRSAWRLRSHRLAFNPAFDGDGDLDVDALGLVRFRANYPLPPDPPSARPAARRLCAWIAP